jgi:hypothetical protein
MKSLILELPGIFDKHLSDVFRASLQQLQLPLFSQLISKAEQCSMADFNGVQYSALELSGDTNPSLAVESLGLSDLDSNNFQYWFRADPVELLTDISTIHLKGNRHFKLSEHQIKQFELNINKAIDHLDAHFFLVSETEGYIGCNQKDQVSFVSLLEALGNNQLEMTASGTDGAHWRQLLTEIQMSLFGEGGPENIAKSSATINSVHFWGNPNAEIPQQSVDKVVTDSNLILGIAEASNIATQKLSDFNGEINLLQAETIQIVPMDLLSSQKHGDIIAWENILLGIETNWLPNIFSALAQKKLQQIEILTGSNTFYLLKKSHLKKFWRRTKSLVNFIEG